MCTTWPWSQIKIALFRPAQQGLLLDSALNLKSTFGKTASLADEPCSSNPQNFRERRLLPNCRKYWGLQSRPDGQPMCQEGWRRSWLCWVGACMVSAFLCATCAAVLAPISLAESLEPAFGAFGRARAGCRIFGFGCWAVGLFGCLAAWAERFVQHGPSGPDVLPRV